MIWKVGRYALVVGCLVMLGVCACAPQPIITPQPTAHSLAAAPTDVPPTPSSVASPVPSPQPTSTFRPTPGPAFTALSTPRSTTRAPSLASLTPHSTLHTPPSPLPTPRLTPSPISVSSTPTGWPSVSPTAAAQPTTRQPTATSLAPRSTLIPLPSTPSAPLIPPSAPRVYETTVTLSTYGYQQALEPSNPDDPIYPYPRLNPDRVGPPAPKNYRAIILENSYTQATILPELGGRLWRIVDKTTGRQVTYQNPVVKPTHWGYRGWWLATGGVEWCLPVEEHGLNEYRPWNVSIGGSSVTVSDHEDRTGLDVAVTISLDAAHSYVTLQPRVTNSTGSPQKMQLWVNAMLALSGNRASDSTRFILPGAQVTLHSTGDGGLPGPGSKLDWPVFKGRDLSRYANWQGYLGFFASPAARGDFAGAYDTSSDQGIVRVFPSGVARGVKYFGSKGIDPSTWTDDGSTYFELWGGLLPTFWDYATIQPGQAWGWIERWYPVSGLGQGFDTANATAALRLSSQSDGVTIGAVTSTNLNGQVKLWQDGQVAATWQVAVGPGRAFNTQWSAVGGSPSAVGLQLLDSAGNVVAQMGNAP